MKASSLLHHIFIALVLTGVAAISEVLLKQFFSELPSIKLSISLVMFLYLCDLIYQSRPAIGKLTLFAVNLSVLLISLFTVDSLTLLLLLYTAIIWSNRALLCYASIVAVLTDLSLCVISAAIVLWVCVNGNSLMTALWCFLLLQALHTLIPGKKLSGQFNADLQATDAFNRAMSTAENALQQLLRKA